MNKLPKMPLFSNPEVELCSFAVTIVVPPLRATSRALKTVSVMVRHVSSSPEIASEASENRAGAATNGRRRRWGLAFQVLLRARGVAGDCVGNASFRSVAAPPHLDLPTARRRRRNGEKGEPKGGGQRALDRECEIWLAVEVTIFLAGSLWSWLWSEWP